MGDLHLILILIAFTAVELTVCFITDDKEELLNWCLASRNHKRKPGREERLYGQCSPWKENSCCTTEVAKKIHESNMYNFTLDHCPGKPMSENCRRHFIQDNCFYECEPHIGFWVVETNRKIAAQRFKRVPLCALDCESWFSDCKNDYTCAHNWPKDFKFSQGHNSCKEGSECMPFKKMYQHSKEFCENVWDHSWKYTANDKECMMLWLNRSQPNPNRRVAEYYINKHFNNAPHLSIHLSLVIIGLVLTYSLNASQ